MIGSIKLISIMKLILMRNETEVNMKKIFLVVFLMSTIIYSQEKNYFDSPFGAGGGFSPAWVIPNFDELNTQLNSFGTEKFSTSGMFGTGGTGFIYLSFIPNIRLGGMGLGASSTVKGIKDGFEREVEYSISFGGFTLEYTLPFIRGFGVSIGAIFGGGSTEININRNKNSFSWNGLWNELNDPNQKSEDISRKLSSNYFVLAPTLNFDFPFYRFLSFRIGAGYRIAFSNNWNVENEKDIFNVPTSLNSNSLFIQSGLFIGFFSF